MTVARPARLIPNFRFDSLTSMPDLAGDQDRRLDETIGDSPASSQLESIELPGGRYRILGEIARGGMGVVLRAHDVEFDRTLAIKMLLPRTAQRADDERRFLEEAGITGRLQHPGIPPAHEIGRLADGRPYFSMKLIEGRTLAELLRERATPQTNLAGFLKIFEQIAQTLAYAHSQGIIHRDLKPLNVMVGAFGEVQVMDWGLAKRLRREQAVDAPHPAGPPVDIAPSSATDETVTLVQDTAEGSQTQAGQVLGTLAYMAPEQARGEIHSLDERCDVFGLGAILCTILTGRPPYDAREQRVLWYQAQNADLDPARSRLDVCGADKQLVSLAIACLEPRKEDRPANAREVADSVADHLATVQERLQQAKVAQAAAEVQAREEGKRRRLAVGLALAVVSMVAGAGAAGLWYVRDQGKREAELTARRGYLERAVSTALDESERQRQVLHSLLRDERQAPRLLSELDKWQGLIQSAQAEWKRADTLAEGGREVLSPGLLSRLDDLDDRLRADETDWRLAVDLDRIRLEASDPDAGGDIKIFLAAPKLEQAFREAGYDFGREVPDDLAGRIQKSAIRPALVAALDFWALVTRDAWQRGRILDTLRTADPQPWGDRFRQPDVLSGPALEALAREVDPTVQTPQLLAALAQRLRLAGGDAPTLLRHALIAHPRDFWLLFELGMASGDPTEQAGAFRAALAIRPDSSTGYYSLGVVENAGGNLDVAEASYRKSIELDPTNAGAHCNLGFVLDALGRIQEAEEEYRKALVIDPFQVESLVNLGGALQQRGDLKGAKVYLLKALEVDPNHVAGLNNLGVVHRGLGELDAAIECFRRAIARNSEHAMAWCNLGHTLSQQGNFKESIEALKRGHELGSRGPNWTFPSAQWIVYAERTLAVDEKLEAVLRGEAMPADAREELAMGQLCVVNKKRFAAAARFFAAAFAAEPGLANEILSNRYNAACAAALASAGQGLDASDLSADERTRLRGQALTWLQAELAASNDSLRVDPATAASLAPALQHWQTDPDLAAVRDEAAILSFPPDEQAAWRTLWNELAALAAR